MIPTLTGLRILLDEAEREQIYKWLLSSGGIGEEIELKIDNGKFELGKFKAKITEYVPPLLNN